MKHLPKSLRLAVCGLVAAAAVATVAGVAPTHTDAGSSPVAVVPHRDSGW